MSLEVLQYPAGVILQRVPAMPVRLVMPRYYLIWPYLARGLCRNRGIDFKALYVI